MIYWTDKETHKDEKYDDTSLPINVQHKLRAYKLRGYLMEHYGELLVSNIENADANKMSYADYTSAHFMAYIHKIVGRNSIFKREADRVFHLKGIFQHCTPEKASEDGFRMNDELAMAIHKNTRKENIVFRKKKFLNLFYF